jgi:hypothetical protein
MSKGILTTPKYLFIYIRKKLFNSQRDELNKYNNIFFVFDMTYDYRFI